MAQEYDPFAFLHGPEASELEAAVGDVFTGSEPVAPEQAAPPAETAAVLAAAPAAVTEADTLSTSQIVGAIANLHERLQAFERLAKQNGWPL